MEQYTIRLKDALESKYIQGVEESIVLRFVQAFGEGEDMCQYKGSTYYLSGLYSFEILKHIIGEPVESIVIEDSLYSRNIGTFTTPKKGENVSEEYIQGPFGSRKFGHRYLQFNSESNKSSQKNTIGTMAQENRKHIFISHSSKDKEIVDHFVDSFLCLGLEISHQNIFCSTLDGMKITTGEEWRHSILGALRDCEIVFVLLSENFTKSEICLVELGAAWGLGKKVIPIVIPPLSPGNSTVLLNPNQSMRINVLGDLDQLRVDTCKALGIEEKVHTGRWNAKKEQFVAKVQGVIDTEASKKP